MVICINKVCCAEHTLAADSIVLGHLFHSWLRMPSWYIWSVMDTSVSHHSVLWSITTASDFSVSRTSHSFAGLQCILFHSLWSNEPGIPGQPDVCLWVAVSDLSLPTIVLMKGSSNTWKYTLQLLATSDLPILQNPTLCQLHDYKHESYIFRGEEPQSSTSLIYSKI